MASLDISPDEFLRLAERITKLTADYLTSLDSRPVFPPTSGVESERLFRTALPEKGSGAEALAALNDVLQNSRAPSSRFFGYVLGSGEPVAALADLLASVLNQNVTAWRSGPAAVSIEQTVIGWLAKAVGCAGFTGSLTGGGSSANLMGLTMAREARMPVNEAGFSGVGQGTVYASEQVHMSIAKSMAVLGLGRKSLRLIPTDRQFRLIPSELEAAIQHDRSAGKIPVAIVACAGATNTGAIDPLLEIAAIARRQDVWLHIDGAYGALAAIAAPHKFDGLDLADSLSLDPHKWLYQPLDCGCLLYRDQRHAQRTFSYSGDYTKVLSLDPIEGFAFFEESLELSRRFRALKLWLSLRYHGLAAFRESIRKDLDHAQRLASAIQIHPEFELMAAVELSAVCFRYKGRLLPEQQLDALNAAILRRVVQRGRVYTSNATLRGKFCLRACVVNHRTTESDIDSVLPEVLAAAAEVEP